MSAQTERDVILVAGSSQMGKTTLIESFLGAYRAPVMLLDVTGEWEGRGTTFPSADDVRTHLLDRLKSGERPERFIRVEGVEACRGVVRLVWHGEIPCTLVADEIQMLLPSGRAACEEMEHCIRSGRHVQGKEYPYGISVIGGVHRLTNTAPAIRQNAGLVAFQNRESGALDGVENRFPGAIEPSQLDPYEFVVSQGCGMVNIPFPEPAPVAYKLDLDAGKWIVSKRFD